MDSITQLTPVQAWLIGAIDQASLRDLIADDPAACREYGQVLANDRLAARLLQEAQLGTKG